MGNYTIAKDFYCDYGHRVWTQELKEQFCAIGDTSCKCKHLHGHTGKISIELIADELTRGFVTDFKHLGFVKDFVDEFFDHRFIIDRNDPMFASMTSAFSETHILQSSLEFGNVWRFVERTRKDDRTFSAVSIVTDMPDEQKEYIESFTVVNFVPTSENLARFMYNFASTKLAGEASVSSVAWKETPKSVAVYHG